MWIIPSLTQGWGTCFQGAFPPLCPWPETEIIPHLETDCQNLPGESGFSTPVHVLDTFDNVT